MIAWDRVRSRKFAWGGGRHDLSHSCVSGRREPGPADVVAEWLEDPGQLLRWWKGGIAVSRFRDSRTRDFRSCGIPRNQILSSPDFTFCDSAISRCCGFTFLGSAIPRSHDPCFVFPRSRDSRIRGLGFHGCTRFPIPRARDSRSRNSTTPDPAIPRYQIPRFHDPGSRDPAIREAQ